MKNIILLGYMGSGKSTIGKILAEKLLFNFVDLDSYIENKEEKSISKIFEEQGDIYFRKIEHEYLKELLKSSKNSIISLGGGTPCYAGNMTIINSDDNSTSIYLKANVSTLVERLQYDKNSRPLIANINNNNLEEYIAKHLFERQYYYHQASSTISVDNKNSSEIADKILTILNTL